jgi:hypothetical protein
MVDLECAVVLGERHASHVACDSTRSKRCSQLPAPLILWKSAAGKGRTPDRESFCIGKTKHFGGEVGRCHHDLPRPILELPDFRAGYSLELNLQDSWRVSRACALSKAFGAWLARLNSAQQSELATLLEKLL